jgi:septal ring factor EnvC (AmiA/AmiB activator)
MLIEILIILFTIIIFYEIFNDTFSFSNHSLMYENFENATDLTNQNNKDVEKLEKNFNDRKTKLDDFNKNLSKINQNINRLNQVMKSKADVGLSKYDEITDGVDVDINNTENT